MLELVRQNYSENAGYIYNDMTDFDIQCNPGVIYELLNEFNADLYES